MTSINKVLVILPAFNEQETIEAVLSSLRENAAFDDVLVINDGSTDRTARIVEEMGVTTLDIPFNVGIGAAVQAGYLYARERGYDYVVRLDADGQHEVSQISAILQPVIRGEADMVIGSRYRGSSAFRSSLPRRIGISLLSCVVSLIARKRITDPTSGFRALNGAVASIFADDYPDDYPEVESIVRLHRLSFRIEEVGVVMAARGGGRSSITFLRSIYYMVKVLIAIGIELLREPGR